MGRGLYVDARTVSLEHAPHSGRDPGSIEPVEGLRKGHQAEAAEVSGEFLGAHVTPLNARYSPASSLDTRNGDHVGISVDGNRRAHARGEQQRQRAWSAADVQQSLRPVQGQLALQCLRDLRRVRQAPGGVVRGAALVQRLVPPPGSVRHG